MLRLRDFAAALAIVVLTRLAYDDPSDSLSASVQLSYYLGRESVHSEGKVHRLALEPVVLDVDGDGTVEALASIMHGSSDEWILEVLDLKPAASTDKTHMAPFRPKSLYKSEPMNFKSGLKTTEDAPLLPVKMATGHVMLKGNGHRASGEAQHKLTHYKNVELNDRNRHYFCGNDWHHASQECSTPCPQGTVSDCPDGQHCYADTPCDISNVHRQEPKKEDVSFSVNNLLVTPAGGLPSVFSLWSNGVLCMHSLTGDYPSNDAKSIKTRKAKELIGIRQMWQTAIVEDSEIVPLEWVEVSLTYVDSTDAGDQSGMVVVQAHLIHIDHDSEDEDELEEAIVMAFNAETGTKLWDASLKAHDDDDDEEEKGRKLPIVDAVQSTGRRRSLKPHVRDKKAHGLASNCLHAYRRSILTSGVILPHIFWGDSDASTRALHFEQQQHNQHAIQAKKKTSTRSRTPGKPGKDKSSSWKSLLSPFRHKRRVSHHQSHLKRGKPNVIVSRSEDGIEVRSLKNGRPVCHLSLWHDTLYTDLNHDGVIDGVSVVTGDHHSLDDDKFLRSEDAKWISKLATRLGDSKMLSEDAKYSEREEQQLGDQSQRLCHLYALSGVPFKEELFSVNLCGNKDPENSLDSAPLLAVETAYGKGQDIIVALNDKTVQRFRGKSGRRMWQVSGKSHDEFPSWDDGYITLLDRIDAANVAPAARPVVLVGDTSIALISPGHGRVLATAPFPLPSIRKPILVDFNGDGTTDIVVITREAVWGYRVTIWAGSSILFRVTVGLLVISLMLAILRNRFGPHQGKRSTDA